MAHASKKHFGAGAQEKGSGEGALTPTPKDKIGENEVLANRDKAQNTGERVSMERTCAASSTRIIPETGCAGRASAIELVLNRAVPDQPSYTTTTAARGGSRRRQHPHIAMALEHIHDHL